LAALEQNEEQSGQQKVNGQRATAPSYLGCGVAEMGMLKFDLNSSMRALESAWQPVPP